MAAHGAPLDQAFELDRLERYTANAQTACDREAFLEAFDQILEAHKCLVRLNDLHPDVYERGVNRRLRKANDAFFLARCRVAAKLGRAE